jgi:SagB-type dehydrogenase family enzyme
LVYWRKGELVFKNFVRRSTVAGAPVACDILSFFNEWRSIPAAISHYSQYRSSSVRRALAGLLKHHLLVREGSPEAREDGLIAGQWADWLPDGSFHFSTKDASYIGSNRSFEELRSILPKTQQPRFFKMVSGAKRIGLPAAKIPDSEFSRVLMKRRTHRKFSREQVTIETIGQLLSLVWGVTGYMESPLFGSLPKKTSPSAGARHPGEVYLMALRVNGLKKGLYHYHPARHRLEMISSDVTVRKAWLYCARQDYVKKAAALFLMTAVFPRTMWKYNKARAYRVVLLDAGHLCQTFCLAATWLDLAPFCTAAFRDTLIENDLAIDGVRESMIYVAGIGNLPA